MITQSDYIEILGLCVGPAVIGLAVTALRHAQQGNWNGVVAGAATSVFVAITTTFLLDLWNFPATVVTAISGLAAYAGGKLLDSIVWRANKEIRTCRLPGIHGGGEE